MNFLEVLAIIIPAALYSAAPLIFTALGGIFSERSGVVNIGLEGLMMFGAFTGIVSTLLLQDSLGACAPWVAIVIAAVVCAVFSLIHAVASITLKADQTVSGVALNFLAAGLSIFLIKKIFGKGQTDFIQFRIDKVSIPGLSDIPVIGKILFSNVPITSYIAIALAFAVWYIIYKTPFGLRLRSVGEHPMAADTMGIKVVRMRYVGVMIFGKWHPIGALGAAMFFGLAQSLSITGAQIPVIQDIPSVLLTIAPYVLTILALTGFVGRAEAPKALGVPYEKGRR